MSAYVKFFGGRGKSFSMEKKLNGKIQNLLA